MLLRSRCSGDNCRCETAHAHHRRSSKTRPSRLHQIIKGDEASHESQGNGAVSGELSSGSFSPSRHSTPLRPRNSLEIARRGAKYSDLSEDLSLVYSESSQTTTTQSLGILRSSDATELQAKQVRFGPVVRNGSPRHSLYSETDESESEVVSGWGFKQGVPNGLHGAADSLNLARGQRSAGKSTTTITTTITSVTDMPGTRGTALYSDTEDSEDEATTQHTYSTTARQRWPPPARPRSVYIVTGRGYGDGASPTLPAADHDEQQQRREAWLATAGGDGSVASAATRHQSLARIASDIFLGFWKGVYVMATAVMVTDAWLLSRMTPQRRKRLAIWLFALIMLPLLAWLYYEENGTSLPSVQPTLASASSHVYGVAAETSKAVVAALASWFPPAWLSWPSAGLPSQSSVTSTEHKKLQLVEQVSLSEERIRILVETELKRLVPALAASLRGDERATVQSSVSEDEVRELKLEQAKQRSTLDSIVHVLEDKKDCCPDVTALLAGLDSRIIGKVLEVLNDTSAGSPSSQLHRWMTEEMDRREDRSNADQERHLGNLLDGHRSSFQSEIGAAARLASEARRDAQEAWKVAEAAREEVRRAHQTVTLPAGSTADVDAVTRVVKEALAKYDADKTGLPDYALESAGGSVVNTRCTDTYTERSPKYYMFGLPLWTFYRTAREAITPGMHPGECWAFRGSQGHLVVKLAQPIKVTAFSVEHISRSLVGSGHTSSAPREFEMWGLDSETDSPGRLLGTYTYDAEGDTLQYFIVQDTEPAVYEYVEMKILSNHGNLEYTCLYRLRVHGEPA
uniref:Putative spindle pole body protein n=1 Tax=Rhipicephalus pulchellus TaxID=72859 RepID=L7LUZ9_RHIPC